MKNKTINLVKYLLLALFFVSNAHALTTEIVCDADGSDRGNPNAKIILKFDTQSLKYQYFEKDQLILEGGLIGGLTVTTKGGAIEAVHAEKCISHILGEDCTNNPTAQFIDFSEKWPPRPQLVVRSYVSLVDSRLNGGETRKMFLVGNCGSWRY